jgi:hypothetical protein
VSPHRCQTPDALGTFDTSDASDNLHKSPYSDSLGFCFDRKKYEYDSNNDNTQDTR